MSFSKKLLPVLLILANVLGNLSFAEAAALRSNQQGQNLLKYSEDFSHATWLKTNIGSTTGGQINPFGGTGAFLITDTNDASSLAHYVRQASTAVGARTWTASFYAKAGTKSFIWAYEPGTGTGVSFDVGTGIVGTPAAGTSASITAVGNGWYRCVLTFRTGIVAGSSIIIQLANSHIVGAYQGNGTGTVYLYGAQIVQDLKPGAYNRTIASTFSPSYVPTGAVRSSLQGQNLLPNSDPATLAQIASKDQVTVAPYSWPAGPGLTNAISFGDNSVPRWAYQQAPFVAGTIYTMRLFVQMSDNSLPVIADTGGTSDFMLVTEGLTHVGTLKLIGGGVYQITYTFAAGSTATSNFGIAKYATNSARTFKASGYSLVKGTKPGAYNRTLASALNTTFTPIGVTRSAQLGQNLLTYSEQFDNAAWLPSGTASTANAARNPFDGNMTADTVRASAGGAFHDHGYANGTGFQTIAPVGSGPFTFSIFVQRNNIDWIAVMVPSNQSGSNCVYFNLATGAFGTFGAGALSAGVNSGTVSIQRFSGGWYRLSVTATTIPAYGGATAGFGIFIANGDNVNNFSAAGTEAVNVWGAQLVKGTKPGAYNKTAASAFNASYQP